MKRVTKVVVSLALAAALANITTTVLAGDATEGELIRSALTEAEAARSSSADPAAAARRSERATALLQRYVDLEAFEDLVLADVAASLTPEQRKEVTSGLRELLASRIALRLPDMPSARPAIDAPRVENGETHVRLVYRAAVDGGPPGLPEDVEVDLLFKRRSGRLRVVDVTIAGARLSKNLRASVNNVMRRQGYSALLARLAELRQAKAPGPHKSSDLTL
jgi:ABC-type transporter MlaC component